MDENQFELADRLATASIEGGIARARRRMPPPIGYDGTCPQCGEEVPQQRIMLNLYNCVTCQSKAEARGKIYQKG